MTDVKQWYEEHGVEYLEQDWGLRAENGESASLQTQLPERVGRAKVSSMDPHAFGALEEAVGVLRPVWTPRDQHDRLVVEAVEDFFETHLPVLRPEAKQQALEDLMYARASLNELAAERGVTKQAVSQARKRALAWVQARLSEQWPDPEGATHDRAWAVFMTYWRDRFGVEYPNTTEEEA